jgi:hypothetical protein
VVCVGFILATLLAGCDRRVAPRFVPGSEAGGLAERVGGYLVIRQGWDSAEPDPPRIIAVALYWGRSARTGRSRVPITREGGTAEKEMFRQEGLYPVYAPRGDAQYSSRCSLTMSLSIVW